MHASHGRTEYGGGDDATVVQSQSQYVDQATNAIFLRNKSLSWASVLYLAMLGNWLTYTVIAISTSTSTSTVRFSSVERGGGWARGDKEHTHI